MAFLRISARRSIWLLGWVVWGVLAVPAVHGQRLLAERLQAELQDPELGQDRRLESMLERTRALISWSVPEALQASEELAREARSQDRADIAAVALAIQSRLLASTEGVTRAMEVLDRAARTMPPNASTESRGRFAVIEVGLYYTIDEYGLAAETLERALELAESSGSPELMADCLLELHDVFFATGTAHDPRADLERAEELMVELGDERGRRRVHLRRADILRSQGQEAEADLLLEEVIASARRSGDRGALLAARDHLYWTLMEGGDFEGALALTEEDLATTELLGSDELLAATMDRLAWAYHSTGRPEDAAPLVEDALEIAEHLELRALQSMVIDSALELARARGDADAMLEYSTRQNELAQASMGRATRDVAETRSLLRELRGERRELHAAAERQRERLEEERDAHADRIATYRWSVAAVALVGLTLGVSLLYRGKRRAEKMHRQLVEQTAHARRTEEARKRLERRVTDLERLDGLGLLAAGFAHDFNNILVTISGNAELIGGTTEGPPHDLADEIAKAAHRAADLCKRLMDYARPSPDDSEHVDLNELVREARTLLDAGGGGAARLELDLQEEPLPTRVDRSAIEQVLVNLVQNARDSRLQTTTVTIRTRKGRTPEDDGQGVWFGRPREADEYGWIEVVDDGRGMKPEILHRVFDPFFTTRFEGRGLGLAAAYGIVKAHGGAFRVHSEEGHGSTFSACLPLSEGVLASSDGRGEPVHELTPARPPSPKRVLAVDDEAGVLSFVEKALSREGHEVQVASSSAEALGLLDARRDRVDLVLLDLSMPEVDGSQLLEELGKRAPDVPVVMMSGHDETFVLDRVGNRAIAGVLRKPFAMSELVAAVRESSGEPTLPDDQGASRSS